MPPREDLFTPVHKGLRSMIYTLGTELQSADFSQVEATEALTARLRHELTLATQASCVLCHLHDHAGKEEVSIFPELRRHEPALVDEMVQAHSVISQKLTGIARNCDALLELQDAPARLASGKELVQRTNDFFAFYLAHMNREEAEVVPATQRYFTDPELAAIRGRVMASFTPPQLAAMMKWMLPALNIHELTGLLTSIKATAPAPAWKALTGLAAESLGPDRWQAVAVRVGL